METEIGSFADAAWIKTFFRALKQHPAARESLSNLTAEGMPQDELLRRLAYYSHPAPSLFEREFRVCAKETVKLAQKTELLMKELANRLRPELPRFELELTTDLAPMARSAFFSLTEAIDHTRRLTGAFKKRSSLKGKARPDAALVYLCLRIEAATGRPHWEDIAYLLEAALLASGQDVDWNEDSLRRIVKRFEKYQTNHYHSMREMLFDGSEARQAGAARKSTRNRQTP